MPHSGQGNRSHKNRTEKKRGRRMNQPLFYILLLFFGSVFILSAFIVTKHLIESGQEKKSFSDLAMSVTQVRQAAEMDGLLGIVSDVPKPQLTAIHMNPAVAEEQPEGQPERLPEGQPEGLPEEPQYTEYAALYAGNSDFVGWLHIDNTGIDYPVMFTPDEPEYYLHRAFDKTHSQSGTPFIGTDCTIDSDYYIIYGHNMKNDTMFGTLDHYAKKAFWEKTPTFSFTTVTEEREYEVFAALKTRVLYQKEKGYRYYSQVGELSEEAFDELIKWFRENALYDTGITPTYGEQIVVLSTCSYHEDNGRFIIAARRVASADE